MCRAGACHGSCTGPPEDNEVEAVGEASSMPDEFVAGCSVGKRAAPNGKPSPSMRIHSVALCLARERRPTRAPRARTTHTELFFLSELLGTRTPDPPAGGTLSAPCLLPDPPLPCHSPSPTSHSTHLPRTSHDPAAPTRHPRLSFCDLFLLSLCAVAVIDLALHTYRLYARPTHATRRGTHTLGLMKPSSRRC